MLAVEQRCQGRKGKREGHRSVPLWGFLARPVCVCVCVCVCRPVGIHMGTCVCAAGSNGPPLLLCVSKYSSYYPGDKEMFSAQLKLLPEPIVAREPKLSGWPPPSEETPKGGVGAGAPQLCGCGAHSASPSCPVPALSLQPDWTQMPWRLRPNWADHGARRL